MSRELFRIRFAYRTTLSATSTCSIVSGEEFEESKPNPEIYLSVPRALNCTAEECIVVEDSEYGIAAGKAAGMYVVARRESELPVCQKEADIIIDSLDEIVTCLGRFDRRDI